MTILRCAMASRTQSGLTIVAKITIASAPTAMRAVTAPVGLHPAFINALASGPDMPKLSAEATANSRPSRKWSTPLVSWVAVIWHLPHVMSKIDFGHDASRR